MFPLGHGLLKSLSIIIKQETFSSVYSKFMAVSRGAEIIAVSEAFHVLRKKKSNSVPK